MTDTTVKSQLLDRKSNLPLHHQLRQILLSKIERGEWQLGQTIPREIDLMEEYGLSRYTVRQALEGLSGTGYLVRTKGRGTVVSRPKVEQNLSHFYSFARDMSAKGLEPTSRILLLEEIIPNGETASILNLPVLEAGLAPPRVQHLRRLRQVNGEPLLIESSYLYFGRPVELAKHDWRFLAIYNVLESYYDIIVERAEEFLELINLELEEANLLAVPVGTAAFRVERHTYDIQGRIFERRVSLIRGDRYRFRVELPKIELIG